ncbi:MAG: hypothetical protein IKT27_00875 [Clostridia bacterium]|nr:hypothetical protein [Clostridia bacterium]
MKESFITNQHFGLKKGLSLKELLVYGYITECVKKEDILKLKFNGEDYYKLNLEKVVKDMPLLGSTKTVGRAFKALFDKKLLERKDNDTKEILFKFAKLEISDVLCGEFIFSSTTPSAE